MTHKWTPIDCLIFSAGIALICSIYWFYWLLCRWRDEVISGCADEIDRLADEIGKKGD